LINRYVVGGSVAEIIAASPDGNTLVFTNAGDAQIGFVDISNPENPTPLGAVDMPGEPTSVTVTPNGQYAIAAVADEIDEDAGETIANQEPGTLVFIDMASRDIVAQVPLLGIGPDSIDISPNGEKLVVAIEDEEDTDNLPGSRPGSINFVTLDYDNPANSVITSVPLDLTGIAGVNYQEDPQPEFVKFSPNGDMVAVTVQENNAIALIDANSEEVIRIFSAGTSTRDQADLTEDGDIRFTEPFEGRREPDAIAFTPDGEYLITANEGDTDLESFGDNVWSGGRGWTIFDLNGNVVYDGTGVELLAAQRGQYPEGRSENRGLEMEGATLGVYGDRPIAFVGSERGSFVLAYDISFVTSPRLISFMPTGFGPEGLLALPSRGLMLASNEEDGTIDFFQMGDRGATNYSTTAPELISRSPEIPFSAISGAYQVPGRPNTLVAVPDSAMAPSRIFTINMQGNTAVVDQAMTITRDGEPMSYDLEGIAMAPDGSYWVVSEGDDREGQEKPNRLLQVNAAGEVMREVLLPEADAAAITRFGFEGVTTSADGSKVYVAVQREFEGDPENQVRIGEYDVARGTWTYYFYPLDTDNVEDSWVGLSEIARDRDGSFVVVERDNQGGENGAANARIKRIYRFSLDGVAPGGTVQKVLVADLLEDYGWIEEKIESLAVTDRGYWVISDNDGGTQYSRMLFIPR